MNITRRKFFFFGLAAGVKLLLPDKKIELDDNELYLYHNGWKTLDEIQRLNPKLPPFFYGIPYHQSDGTVGTWLGIPRK